MKKFSLQWKLPPHGSKIQHNYPEAAKSIFSLQNARKPPFSLKIGCEFMYHTKELEAHLLCIGSTHEYFITCEYDALTLSDHKDTAL